MQEMCLPSICRKTRLQEPYPGSCCIVADKQNGLRILWRPVLCLPERGIRHPCYLLSDFYLISDRRGIPFTYFCLLSVPAFHVPARISTRHCFTDVAEDSVPASSLDVLCGRISYLHIHHLTAFGSQGICLPEVCADLPKILFSLSADPR